METLNLYFSILWIFFNFNNKCLLAIEQKQLDTNVTIITAATTTTTTTVQPESYTMKKAIKILVTHPEVPRAGLDLMAEKAELIVCQSLPPNRTEILEKVKGVNGLFWGSHEPLNAEILDAAGPQLKAITTMSAGIDYVDIKELQKRNIPLGHTPKVLSDAVADLGMTLMLAAARRVPEGRQKIQTSNWLDNRLQWMLGQDIRGSVVGFFGFGNIGKTIARRLKGFDIDSILYTTRHRIDEHLEKEYKATKVPFHDLLEKSDILFVAAPLTNETYGVFNSTAFSKMKPTAIFINIARGQIVNQEDLYKALKNNQIFAAGIDVMYPEPLPADDPLLKLTNLVITPHIGSATNRTRTEMSILAAKNLLLGLAGERMLAPAY